MPSSPPAGPKDAEVFLTTEKGNRELMSAGTSLSVVELQLLVMVDGFSNVGEIARHAPGISREELNAGLRNLVDSKLIVSAADARSTGMGYSAIGVPSGFFGSLSNEANPEADAGAAILKRKGYYVRIARRAADRPEVKEGWKPTILVVDDDPDLQKLIRTYLMLEGFVVRAAMKRDDIVISLRQAPAPDLALLDVQLPDANGFDILFRMRQHPVLKNMPIIMLTAESTREAVLRGLQGGADGYVTKPFDPDLLVSAVKAVLGQ